MICWLKSRSGLTKTKTIRKWSWFHLHWESAYVHGTCWRAECPVWWYSRNQILDPGTCSGMLGHLSRFDVEHHCEIFRHRRSLLEVFFPHYWEFFSLRSGINKTLETHLCRKTYVREARLFLDSSRKLSAHSTSLYLRKLFLFAPHGQEGAIISAPLLTTEVQACEIDRSHWPLYLQTDGEEKYSFICEIWCFIACVTFNAHTWPYLSIETAIGTNVAYVSTQSSRSPTRRKWNDFNFMALNQI